MKYRQFIAAMRKNGYEKVKHSFIMYEGVGWHDSSYIHHDAEVIGACAIGQAGLNLDIDPQELVRRLSWSLKLRIYALNDETDLTIPQIADQIEREYQHLMEETF